MSNVIVVGVDGTDTARAAGRAAAQLAAATGAFLHVLTAFDKVEIDELEVGSDKWTVSSSDAAARVASQVAEELATITPLVTSEPLEGKPAQALVAAARRLDAKLIVVGNRRVQGISRILGSVALSVAQQAPCDVYIVKTV